MIPAEHLIIALFALVGVMYAALVAGGVTLVIQFIKSQNENQLLWRHNRDLVDHIYRGADPPPPAAPRVFI